MQASSSRVRKMCSLQPHWDDATSTWGARRIAMRMRLESVQSAASTAALSVSEFEFDASRSEDGLDEDVFGFASETLQTEASPCASPPVTPRRQISGVDWLSTAPDLSPPPAPRTSAAPPLLTALRTDSANSVLAALADDPCAAAMPFFDHGWEPPLCCAVRLGCNVEVVGLLIKHGAVADVRDNTGMTPLGILCACPQTATMLPSIPFCRPDCIDALSGFIAGDSGFCQPAFEAAFPIGFGQGPSVLIGRDTCADVDHIGGGFVGDGSTVVGRTSRCPGGVSGTGGTWNTAIAGSGGEHPRCIGQGACTSYSYASLDAIGAALGLGVIVGDERERCLGTAKALLDAGADPFTTNGNQATQKTCVELALAAGNMGLYDFLLDHIRGAESTGDATYD
eukprot:CAMPEP_0117531278 /NCGR_PEP_ID=MMETSP0784-20121206/38776_1 /TAXON_ID=39447 /ORGANISM="" /LENGTH=395 /DNA_ID=CAMNT_0005327647 /DNA_START=1 /DNA_END=1188 /DNA_ORIENTATION=+